MTDLLAARAQMATSLAFHIVFAACGMGLPLLMAMAEILWLRTGDEGWRALAKRWAKGTAILFAVGAVSGTILSFELGLLWPRFMELAGPIIGMPFSLEGFAFFTEAIFLGIYLYGWDRVSPDRVSPRAHVASGLLVAISGILSGMFVICANAWMNDPTGFTMVDGKITEIRPWEAMFNPSALPQGVHMVIAAVQAVGFGSAALHAYALLRRPGHPLHKKGFLLSLAVGGLFALIQPLSGHQSAEHIAERQPMKLAAAEAHWRTTSRAPALVGGWADEEREVTEYAIEIPALLSVLAHGDPDAVVLGLEEVPPEERPPVAITHLSFDLMVGIGTAMAGVAAVALLLAWRRREALFHRRFLWLIVAMGPLGFVAIEAGWMVTELGRQPWVIMGIMRTEDAVTPLQGLQAPFLVFTGIYLGLTAVVIRLVRRQVLVSLDEAPHA